jgi:hypothetical protein
MQKSLKKLVVIPFAVMAFGLVACSLTSNNSVTNNDSSYTVDTNGSENNGSASANESESVVSVSSTSSANTSYTAETGAGSIVLAQGNSSISSSTTGVTIDNTNNIIHITAFGTYVITGSLTNGNILIETPADTEGDVELDLNGVSVTKDSSANKYAPIFSVNDAHLKIKRVENSTSTIIDKRTADTGDDGAAIFSNKKLKIVGTGSLNVTSTYNNGVASDSHVEIKNGALSVTAPNNCVKAHNSVVLGDATDAGSFILKSTGSTGAGVRVDKVEAVTTPVYGLTTTDDDINGIELKTGAYEITAVGKGLSSEAYLYMEGGNGTITSTASHGIKAELDLQVDGGVFTVKATAGDCFHSSTNNVICNGGTYTLTSSSTSGCQGIKAENIVYINGGFYKVTASYEGIAAHKIVANGGTTSVVSSDDGWSAGGTSSQDSSACSITINAGYHYAYANGDGLDSNGDFTVTGGTTIVSQSSNANGPLDYGESTGTFSQSGGILVAYGTGGMAVGATTGDQGSVLVSSHSSMAVGSYYAFTVGTDKYAVKLTKASTTVYASFPGWAASASYGIYSASAATIASTEFELGNLYKVSAYTSSSTIASGTFSSSSLHVGGSSGGGQGGGPGGGGHPGW